MDHAKIKTLFDSEEGWTTQFEIDGIKYGGNTPQLVNDQRLLWHTEQAGGLKGKSVLELGPLEGAHTKTMLEAGAKRIIAIEGNADCYRRCRIVEEVFSFSPFVVDFRLADFTQSVASLAAEGMFFDVISASGVLYHQLNPARLIFDLAYITDTVFVWSHVASERGPNGGEINVDATGGQEVGNFYDGKINEYGRNKTKSYCAGLNEKAVWLYPDEMIRCFRNAGFKNIVVKEKGEHPNGDYILFIAKKR
jgi:hypothetical protein